MYTMYSASFWQFNPHTNSEFNRKYTCAWEHTSREAKREVKDEVQRWLSETTKDCPRSVRVLKKCYSKIFPSIQLTADSEELILEYYDEVN